MKMCYDNPLKELKKIVETKAKYQKVMLLFDDTVSNVEISEVYDAIKQDCIYNQSNILELDEKEILNGYRLIIYFCCVNNFLKCNFNRSEFVNVFFIKSNSLMPFFLNEQSIVDNKNNYLITDGSCVDLQMMISTFFNKFYNYLKSLLCGRNQYFNFSINNVVTHQNILNEFNEMEEGLFILDVDILKRCDIDYNDLIYVDLLIIDGILLLITSVKNRSLSLVDIYKSAKDDYKMIEKFYRLYNNESFKKMILLNFNCLYNYCLKTKQKILEYISFFESDREKIDVIIKKLKTYAKQDNEIMAYLYLFNIFNA